MAFYRHFSASVRGIGGEYDEYIDKNAKKVGAAIPLGATFGGKHRPGGVIAMVE
jgi:hypothetical protein